MHSNRSQEVRRTRSEGLGGSSLSAFSLSEWLKVVEELDVDVVWMEADEIELGLEADPGRCCCRCKVVLDMASIMDGLSVVFKRGLLLDQGVPCSSMTR